MNQILSKKERFFKRERNGVRHSFRVDRGNLMGKAKGSGTFLMKNREWAARCNVGSTPTIFINGLKLADRSLDGYRNRIDSLLASEGKTISRAK